MLSSARVDGGMKFHKIYLFNYLQFTIKRKQK